LVVAVAIARWKKQCANHDPNAAYQRRRKNIYDAAAMADLPRRFHLADLLVPQTQQVLEKDWGIKLLSMA
jgi:hypothetical protein